MGVYGYSDMFRDENKTFYIPVNSASAACRNDSQLYLNALRDYELWAVQMLDSSGHIPSGLLNGHYQDLGGFDECLEVAKVSPYKVQYCVLRIKNLVEIPKSTLYDWETMNYTGGGIPFLKPYLQIGLCLPSSCDGIDLNTHYSQLTRPYNMSVELDKHSCTASDEREQMKPTAMDIITGSILVFLIVLCGGSTVYDLMYSDCKEPGVMLRLFRCFSFYQNGLAIFKVNDGQNPLSHLHGIRTFATIWIFFAHHILLMHSFPLVNYRTFLHVAYSLHSDMYIHGELAVDTFLVLSGVLLSYFVIKHLDSGKKFNYPLYYIHRILRVCPPFYIQLMITMSLFRYSNNGPLWKHYIHTVVDNCYASWWSNLLFVNNYVTPDRQCIGTAWYLAVDMQLYLIAPFILIPLAKRKRIITHFLLPALIVGANVVTCLCTYINHYPSTHFYDRAAFRPDMYSVEYTPTHMKLSPWLIGIMAGYMLRSGCEKMTKAQAYAGWIVSTTLLILMGAILRYQHMEGVGYSLLLATLHNGLHSTVWALFVAWVIIACECGYGGVVKTFLSWKVFQPLGRLTFTIYLLGIGIQYGLMGSRQTSLAFNKTEGYKDVFGELLFTLLVAPLFSVLFEAPFMKLNHFVSAEVSKKKTDLSNDKNLKEMEPINGSCDKNTVRVVD